jgi:TonB family protein
MIGPKRTLPWIISFGLHAAILLVPVGIIISSAPPTTQELGMMVSIPSASAGAESGQGAGIGPSGKGNAAGVPTPGGRVGRLPSIAPPQVTYDTTRGVQPLARPQPGSNPGSLTLPSALDVLSDMTSGRGATETPAPAAGPSAGPAVATAVTGPVEAVMAQGVQIGWTGGAARKLIRKPDPQFPSLLSASGQEVDCEARITVAPTGAVTRVEITASSGYIEIDASVETALRNYLFSRVDGKNNAVGTVKFRFRLEKRD